MKKILLVGICILMLAVSACNQGGNAGSQYDNPKDLIIVGFSQVGAESDWRRANTKSMRDTFSEDNGYLFILRDAQGKQ